ncbi:MAG: NUDIX hydrolase, partial [Bacteroidetes bacterium]|nr:NUDIX hydrolase [Bacteroidota bacterium]
VKLISEAGITRHTYLQDGIPILKYTYWFNMEYALNEKLVPQSSEGITETKWIPKEDVADVLLDAYRSIKELLN